MKYIKGLFLFISAIYLIILIGNQYGIINHKVEILYLENRIANIDEKYNSTRDGYYKELQVKRQMLESEMNMKQLVFQKQVSLLQEKISKGLITRYKAESEQQSLAKADEYLMYEINQMNEELQQNENLIKNKLAEIEKDRPALIVILELMKAGHL